ncbi:MAG: ArsR/SmtB family transcription factor [Anaerolineales bacterium]
MRSTLRDEIYELHAEICQALSEPKRILLLYELADRPSNVGELVDRLGFSQPMISRHLKVLRERGMVRAERDGLNINYSLADERVIAALDLLRGVLATRLEKRTALMHALH